MNSVTIGGVGGKRVGNLEWLKLWAFLLMLVDHLSKFVLDGAYPWMEQAGRVVFPVFAFVLGYGLRGASSGKLMQVAARILLIALVAELCGYPLVALELRSTLNVCWTLAAGVLFCASDRVESAAGRVGLIVAGVLLSWWAEYWVLGALLVWAFWAGRAWAVWACLLALCLYQFTLVPLLVVPVAAWALRSDDVTELRFPRLAFGAGYAAQFGLFSVLAASG